MLLSIITLNYKKPELTLACMQSLNEQFSKEFAADQIELLIVDNDSQDDSVKILRREIETKKYKNMQVIANPTNAGFGAGCNTGAKASKGEFILFQNNDTLVKDAGPLKMALYMQEHPEIAILGGQMRNFDGTLQASTGKFYTLRYAALLLLGGQRFGLVDRSPERIEKVDWVKGSLLMMRREVFTELAGFDEKIFMYTEDMELCYRAKLAGHAVYFYPDVQVLHKDQGSTNKTFAIVNIYKNLLYFYKKHRSKAEYQLMRTMLVAKARVLISVGKASKKTYLVETYEKALAAL
ncbi:MAG: glycosyltransferase family 2 protein [Candidatus Levybacteria bacterium]|nr:glycosyltransferase family 2 protein [Candidatus Levybacteria bacterium]